MFEIVIKRFIFSQVVCTGLGPRPHQHRRQAECHSFQIPLLWLRWQRAKGLKRVRFIRWQPWMGRQHCHCCSGCRLIRICNALPLLGSLIWYSHKTALPDHMYLFNWILVYRMFCNLIRQISHRIWFAFFLRLPFGQEVCEPLPSDLFCIVLIWHSIYGFWKGDLVLV